MCIFQKMMYEPATAIIEKLKRQVPRFFAHEIIYFPCNIRAHWFLILVDTKQHMIVAMDSKSEDRSDQLNIVKKLVEAMFVNSKMHLITSNTWRIKQATRITRKFNEHDCGTDGNANKSYINI